MQKMSLDEKHRTTFALRLPVSLKDTANQMALRDGVSLNYFIAVAVAEKISRLQHETQAQLGALDTHRRISPPATGIDKLTFHH
jgi:hypothetical protein